MTYALPSFSFYYLVRDLGEDIEDAEVQQVDGGQGLVRYVTSITDEPLLDIRDTVELGTFSGLATFFRALAWVVAPLPLLDLARHAGALRPQAEGGLDREAAGRGRAGPHRGADPRALPSIWEARRAVGRELSGAAAAAPRRPRGPARGPAAGAGARPARLPAGRPAGPGSRRHRPRHPAARRRAEGQLPQGGARGARGPARRLSAGARDGDAGAGRAPGRARRACSARRCTGCARTCG